jgi:hypothetical protein
MLNPLLIHAINNNNINFTYSKNTNSKVNNDIPDNITNLDNNSNYKYNPDVINKYSNVLNNRSNLDYNYTTDIWKPIIGSVNKININKDDFKINIDKINEDIINKKYEDEFNKRIQEREKINNIIKNNNVLLDTNNSNNKLEDTFIELKDNSLNKSNINNINNIDIKTLHNSIDQLEQLLNSI